MKNIDIRILKVQYDIFLVHKKKTIGGQQNYYLRKPLIDLNNTTTKLQNCKIHKKYLKSTV